MAVKEKKYEHFFNILSYKTKKILGS